MSVRVWYWFAKEVLFGLPFRLICRLSVEGRENLPDDGKCVIAMNHREWYDPIPICRTAPFRISFAAKSELFAIPLFGRLLKKIGFMSIDRSEGGRPTNFKPLVENASKLMDQGVAFGLYPEGTRSKDGNLKSFKRGAVLAAAMTGRPIVPVGVRYKWHFNGLAVHLVIGEPIKSEGRTTRQLTRELELRIAACSGQEVADD